MGKQNPSPKSNSFTRNDVTSNLVLSSETRRAIGFDFFFLFSSFRELQRRIGPGQSHHLLATSPSGRVADCKRKQADGKRRCGLTSVDRPIQYTYNCAPSNSTRARGTRNILQSNGSKFANPEIVPSHSRKPLKPNTTPEGTRHQFRSLLTRNSNFVRCHFRISSKLFNTFFCVFNVPVSFYEQSWVCRRARKCRPYQSVSRYDTRRTYITI